MLIDIRPGYNLTVQFGDTRYGGATFHTRGEVPVLSFQGPGFQVEVGTTKWADILNYFVVEKPPVADWSRAKELKILCFHTNRELYASPVRLVDHNGLFILSFLLEKAWVTLFTVECKSPNNPTSRFDLLGDDGPVVETRKCRCGGEMGPWSCQRCGFEPGMDIA